ncbi:MAG: tRNA (guanosine(37)-N1)-methyltransferase TrmD [Peptococcaceae bacterium]|nr:MAG: tRNA (guanosine(37)-N1)-methyltransferase TrmD [Peptococcaceae bacterium]
MVIDILTLFPDMFAGPFQASIIKNAVRNGFLTINLIDIRDFSGNRHRTVDDAPYGGGAGMVMEPGPIFRAVDYVRERRGHALGRVILLCPQGRPFKQMWASDLAREEHLVLICGHYEGIDERVREQLITDEISIGDYVLTGGELPAMVVVDAVARLVPGVLGDAVSPAEDSFSAGLLEYPHYTRPKNFCNHFVPDVLLSGHHEEIRRWRRRQALLRTLGRRPDLFGQLELAGEDKDILKKLRSDLESLKLD